MNWIYYAIIGICIVMGLFTTVLVISFLLAAGVVAFFEIGKKEIVRYKCPFCEYWIVRPWGKHKCTPHGKAYRKNVGSRHRVGKRWVKRTLAKDGWLSRWRCGNEYILAERIMNESDRKYWNGRSYVTMED